MDWKLGGLIALLALTGCGGDKPAATSGDTNAAAQALALAREADAAADAAAVSIALDLMRSQVASDIALSIDKESVLIRDMDGPYYYACGEALLNRPGPEGDPLALNNARQRFIATINRSGDGRALFDGSKSTEARRDFQAEWDEKCLAS